MAFDCVPSNTREVFWQYTLDDIKMRLRLYLGERQANAVQYFESLALIAQQLFSTEEKPVAAKSVKQAKTKAEITAGMQELFG